MEPKSKLASEKNDNFKKLHELEKKKDSNPTAVKVALMKLKQRAKGDQHLSQERRFYLEVVYPFSSGVPTGFMFFDSHWAYGKGYSQPMASLIFQSFG